MHDLPDVTWHVFAGEGEERTFRLVACLARQARGHDMDDRDRKVPAGCDRPRGRQSQLRVWAAADRDENPIRRLGPPEPEHRDVAHASRA